MTHRNLPIRAPNPGPSRCVRSSSSPCKGPQMVGLRRWIANSRCPRRSAAASRPEQTARISSNRRPAAASRVSLSSSTPLTSRSMLSRHRLGRPRVAGDLYHGCDRIARRRAQAGREHDDLGAAADHAGDRLDVEPRRVHDGQPLAGDRRRVGHDVRERRALAALVRRAERLLFNRRQAAADVAGRRLRAADVEAEGHRVGLDAVDDADQPLRRLGVGRAGREQVLGPHDLRDLAEHGGAAEIDQAIRDAPERRIRGQPRRVVGAAALHARG